MTSRRNFSAFSRSRVTARHSKHPDWDKVWEKVQKGDSDWLSGYFKSHDINKCRDELGNTLLHHAVCDKKTLGIECLSHLFIDPNIKNAAGQTAFQLAQYTDADRYEYLHECHFCIDFDKASWEPNGLDALFAAIYRGDATLGNTSGVMNNGNETNDGGFSALQCAVLYDRPHLIRALHQRFPKLDPDWANCIQYSALGFAVLRDHQNCLIALRECFPAIKTDNVLHVACDYNRSAYLPTLREYFPQLTGNELNDEGDSVLMHAVFENNHEYIRALHSCFPDIDPNLQDKLLRNTALMVAIQYSGSHECISVLFECFPNIDPNKQDSHGDTALMHACQLGLPQSITSLATCFPSTDATVRNKKGETALMFAIKRKYEEKCLIALCESFPNIDPNVQDKRQNTALMYLLKSPNCTVESVSQFLDTFPNVDVNIQNDDGETTLTIAIEKGKAPIVDLLLERFPDILSLTTSAGQTALMLATKKKHINSISMLLKLIAQMQ